MRHVLALINLFLVLALVLAACADETAQAPATAAATPVPTAAPVEPTSEPAPTAAVAEPTLAPTPPAAQAAPLYLAIIWHQHQPFYFQDPQSGVYQKPWVRLHAAKDYVDMAAILEKYPDVRATFNLTPSLLRQIQDLEAGAKDLYQVHTEVPAAQLAAEQKQFIHDRFFDTNPKIIARFPRYQQIADDRDSWANWDTQTWLDLQLLFNLAWTDPDWLARPPLADLVSKGQGFAEEDKAIVLGEHARLVKEVIPEHKKLQDAGQIEVTMTPFYHPILPLVVNSNLAAVAVPDIKLPARYSNAIDAVAQLQLGVDFYTKAFGRPPRGMWPAEGAVAQEIVGMVAGAGIKWMASDEEVLARSLGETGFGRSGQEVVQNADALYRPYVVGAGNAEMYIVFRDKVISDKVGFQYSGTPGTAAAQDLINRLLAIQERLQDSGATGPHLVSVILDGENAWENYPNDGKEFLNSLYESLSAEQKKGTIQTITPSAYVAQFADQPKIEKLWPGSWVSPDYTTWIGEDEENRAWDTLGQVRDHVESKKAGLDAKTLEAVMDAIYKAEGSDWFWWYGADQNSGDDGSFDLQFRLTLQRVYELMNEPVPTFLKVPVIPQTAQAPAAAATGVISPTIDGAATAEEWQRAGYYSEEGGVQATPQQVVSRLWYGFDENNLYLRLDARRPWADVGAETRVGFYLTKPGGGKEQPFSRVSLATGGETILGFGANALLEVTIKGEAATATYYTVDDSGAYVESATDLPAGVKGGTLEVALPYDAFGKPDAGDAFKLRAVVSEGEQRDIQGVPGAGPGELVVPDLGLTRPLITVADPKGDDHGPGPYTYPTDKVFGAGAYDLSEFMVAEDDSNLIFRFTFAGPLNNSWGAPNGMGIHTLDVYIDAQEGGARKLLPGRNAAVPEQDAWDLAIWAEGWTPGLFSPPPAGEPAPARIGAADILNIVSDPAQNRITIRIAKKVLAEQLGIDAAALDPASWGYLAVVMGQEGYPADGVWRVRDVLASAQQWRFGGAPADMNHTRIVDVAYPDGFTPAQEDALSTYPASLEPNMDKLGPDDFAQLPMIRVQ